MRMMTARKQNLRYLPFLLPGLIGVSVFRLLPFADSIRRSFVTGGGRFSGLGNYETTINNEAFRLAVRNTALFTAVCLPLLIGISFIISCALCRMKYIRLIRTILLFPLAAPTAALVMVWRILFSDHGYINGIVTSLGGGEIHFLTSGAAFWVLVGSYIWKNLGYTVILWMTGMAGIPTSITEAARIDGAREMQIITRIIMPNLRPTLYTITIISFLNSFKVFREAYLVAGAYPHRSIYLLQHLFNNWFTGLDLQKMAAASVLVFSVILVAATLLRKAWDKEDV